MSVKQEGFISSDVFQQIADGVANLPEKEKKDSIKKANGVFEMHIKNKEGKEGVWTLEFKKEGKVISGPYKDGKPDIVINTSDETFSDLAAGKVNGQKAFMSGKLKVKGNIMMATKLDQVLKSAQSKL